MSDLNTFERKRIKLSRLLSNEGQLKGVPKNPRIIKDQKFKELLTSLEKRPQQLELQELFVVPYKESFVVIAGNMRLKGCKDLKFKDVPCKIIPAETPEEDLRAYAISTNISYGEWSFDDLGNEWESSELNSLGLNVWEENSTELEGIYEEEEKNEKSTNKNNFIITLDYTEEDYTKVVTAFAKHTETREHVVFKLLGIK